MRKKIKKIRQKLLIAIVIGIILFFALSPIIFMLITSFKPVDEIWRRGLGTLTVENPTLTNYTNILTYNKFWDSLIGPNILGPMMNSFLVTISVTFVSLAIGSLAGYGLALLSVPGKNLVSIYVLFAYIFPPFILVVPLSIFLNMMGLMDSLVGLGLSHLITAIPFVTWMMRSYFMGIPGELVEAGLIDGCTKFSTLTRVILPISSPGLVTAAIFAFTRSWSEFLYALIIIDSREKYTLPVAATALKVTDVIRWGELMSFGVLASLPPVFLYMFIQKYVIGGLVAGATKG